MSYPQADIYDAFATYYWERLQPAVTAALQPWRECTGVALDLGAGTGLSTMAVAAALPAVEILSCEPNPTLRASLMTRIVERGGAHRVTVLPFAASDVVTEVDEPLTIITAFNMIGHLRPEEASAWWRWVSTHLAADGVAVIGPVAAHAPIESCPRPSTFVERRIGRRRYSGTSSAQVTDGHVVWHMAWRVHDGERLVDERFAAIPVDRACLEGPLRAVGLSIAQLDGDLLAVTRGARPR